MVSWQTRIIGFCLLWLVACGGPPVQKQIPISMGIRLDDEVNWTQQQQDLQAAQRLGIRRWMLEVPVLFNTQKQNLYIDSIVYQRFKLIHTHLVDQKLPYGIQFTHVREADWATAVNTVGDSALLAEWQATVQRFLSTEVVQGTEPHWIVLGQDMIGADGAQHLGQWDRFCSSLRSQLPLTKLVYATLPARVLKVGIWQAFDGVGVRYMRAGIENPRAYARQMHKQIDSVAAHYQKPIYLTAANLMGPHKKYQFLNLTRFWPGQPVALLNLNTIYGISPLSDTQSPYSWQGDVAIREAVKDYIEDQPSTISLRQ